LPAPSGGMPEPLAPVECVCVCVRARVCACVAQDRDQWQAVVNPVMYLRVLAPCWCLPTCDVYLFFSLMCELQEYYGTSSCRVDKWEVNNKCCAFSVHHKQWYRAIIVELLPNEQAKVSDFHIISK
jgi:hypothetical protein